MSVEKKAERSLDVHFVHRGNNATPSSAVFEKQLKAIIPGRGQCLFKKLLDLDEVCFQGAVVEEERRVSPRGQVL